jgi:serine/threonine protein phosphatase 1
MADPRPTANGLVAPRLSPGVPPKIPEGRRIYAIGDIHGRADLLSLLVDHIHADAAKQPEAEKVLVFLGDYVDRGADSFAVIETLAAGPAEGFATVCLKGNHEDFLLRFLNDTSVHDAWMMNGGDATLESYGIGPARGPAILDIFSPSRHIGSIRERFVRALPVAHLKFLSSLKLRHQEGDYLFVHAGVRPGVPLDRQDEEDLIWIREEFLNSDARFGKIIVHGHSISLSYKAEVRANRIGIDTGAYVSGRLTCLVLEGDSHRFITT